MRAWSVLFLAVGAITAVGVLERAAAADCGCERCSCLQGSVIYGEVGVQPPTDTPPKPKFRASTGARVGDGAASATRAVVVMSASAAGGALLGAAIPPVSVMQQEGPTLIELYEASDLHAQINRRIEGNRSVATGQGVKVTTNAIGRGRRGDDRKADPVDPVTGEFIIEEIDLALPSWGQPFLLRRLYRSRIDFLGPLGPGWDHSYDQFLTNAPRVAVGSDDPLPTASMQLGDATVTVPVVGVETCGPTVLLSTGEGTTIAFNEIAVSGGTHAYWSSAALLTLTGTDGPDGPTWTLGAPDGSVRHFDVHGRLVRWVDGNGIGLTLAWSGGAADARLETVSDSLDRVITFEYDASNRLTRVSEPTSELEAVYTYGADGGLASARRADGRSESYEYDVDLSRTRGDWVAEQQLRPACAAACARTDSATCSTGGACDAPVSEALSACYQWVNTGTCDAQCHLECSRLCTGGEFSSSLPCDVHCEEDVVAYTNEVAECVRVWNEEGAKELCESCDDQCWSSAQSVCEDLILVGDYGGDLHACVGGLATCCADGHFLTCAEGSCNLGEACEDTCEQAFFGTDEIDTGCDRLCGYDDPSGDPALCPQPVPPTRFGCLRNATTACKAQCGYDCAEAQCAPQCRAGCTQAGCDALDFEGTCVDSCTESCVVAGRDPTQLGGTLFGHAADLNYNIVRVKDGAGRIYLENTYGTNLRSPDFDAVTAQQFGEYHPQLARWDLVASEDGVIGVPLPAWAEPLIEEAEDFESVEICPYTCRDDPFDPSQWDELVVPTATADLYLVFAPGSVTSPVAGFAVNKTLTQSVGPTLVTFSRSVQGVVSGKVSRRTSATNYFATASTSLPITLNGGATVTLATSTNGNVTVTGTAAAKDQLIEMGAMTLFTDAARRVKAYPGAPVEALEATSGSCAAPFTYERVSDTEIRLSPATACTGDLWLTAMGGRYPDQAAADRFPTEGLSALSATAFHPVTLSPTRAGAIWRQGIDGRRVREAPPSGAGATDASRSAVTQYSASPMFSAPSSTSGLGEPLFVFHHVAADYRVASPPPPPSDRPWQQLDLPMPTVPLTCGDSAMPAEAIRGAGARPTQATAIIDFHGARWTEYADENNHILRSINHETGAVWSFDYDPIGQMIGVEHPDLARTCLVYDPLGNVKRRVHMPAVVPDVPTPDPIREDFEFHKANAALTKVGDPRSPGSWLQTITRDDDGNPMSVQAAGGVTIATFTPIGEDGPDRHQIAAVTLPGNAVTALTYEAGVVATVTIDPTGASLVEVVDPDPAGRTVGVTGALGLDQTRVFDGPFVDHETWDADGHAGERRFEYDGDGQVSAVLVGAPGAPRLRTELAYDLTGPVTSVRQVALDGSAVVATICRDIAPGGRVRETVSAEGTRTRYSHDGEGHVTSIVAGDLGPSPRSWDDACVEHPASGTEQFTVASFTYDTSGRLITSTDERGRITTIIRDGLGRPVMQNRPDGTQVRTGYDALGNVVWEALYSTATAPSYRPPSWSDGGLQAATQMVYDERARLKEVHRWHFDGAQVPVGDGYATTVFAYNDVAHTVTRTDDANHQWVTRFDAAGRLVEERAPDGTVRTLAYPGTDHRTVRISEPGPTGTITREVTLTAWGAVASDGARVGTTTHPLTTTQFDELLRPTVSTTLTGGSTLVTYDAFGRISREQHAVPGGAGETIDVAYDRDGRPLSRTSAADGATTGTWNWRYDVLGREVDAQDPTGRHTTTTYVVGSQLPEVVTDPRGVQFQHTWSANSNTLFLNAVDPGGPDTWLTYVWNGRGGLVSASRTDEGQPQVTSGFSYDSLGDRTRETDNQLPAAWTRTTTYDGRGLPIKTTTNTTNWTREYDVLGRLDNIKVGAESTSLAKYTYAGFDFRLTRLLGNGVETRTTYDTLGRPISQTDMKHTTTLASWSYQVPLDGVPRRADFRRASVGGENSVFTIDAALRLLDEDNGANPSFALTPTTSWSSANASASAALGAQASRYTLDGHSAWTRKVIGASVVDYLRDAGDALTRIDTQNVTLDLSGAITNDGELAVVYDALGQVQRVTKGTTGRTYRRDALGRVISETDQASAVTRYAWDGSARIVRQRPNGTTFDITVDGAALDEHVATITGSARQFLHQDRRGSVYMISNNSGAASEWTSYTAYGEATLRNASGAAISASGVNAQFGFNGLPHDVALGLVDMRARLYNPKLGRFLSPDPLGLIDGTNRFAFVGAMPLSFSDPFGLSSKHKERCADADRYYPHWTDDRGFLGTLQDIGSSAVAWAVDGADMSGRIALAGMTGLVSIVHRPSDLGGGIQSALGGDPNSSASRWTEGTLTVVSVAAGGVGLWRGAASALARRAAIRGVATDLVALDGLAGRTAISAESVAGAADGVAGAAPRAGPLPAGEQPYQLKLFADVAYNRGGHYGRTPTPQQRASVPAGMEFDHNPTLVQHYYEGTNGGLPGFNLTGTERLQFARSLTSGSAATPAQQRAQGGWAAAYSRAMKKLWGL